MYDSLLRLNFPEDVSLVAFADDVAIVGVRKHLEEITTAFSAIMTAINNWMGRVDLSLAEHKTEALLVRGVKIRESLTLALTRLNFKDQIISGSCKAETFNRALSWIMPNIGVRDR